MNNFIIKNIVIILLSFVVAESACAQEITIKDFYISPDDKTAQLYPRYDNGENICALVKIKTDNLEGLTFTNHNQYIGAVTYKDGVYYVYIPTLTRRLAFAHNNYQPGTIEFSEFGYAKSIKGGKTYECIIQAPNNRTKKSGISFKVYPNISGCKVILDGDTYYPSSDGITKIDCESGPHKYVVTAPNYKQETGHVDVAGNYVPVTISLHPETILVTVCSNPSNAEVFLDNVDYGKTGTLSLPLGHHELRLSAKGYLDFSTEINITPSTTLPMYHLQQNKGRTVDVHPVPVKVYCQSTNLYKNNKKIKEWTDGGIIYFMPGSSCRLSDDYGKGEVFKVGDSPMTIKLSNGDITVLSYTSCNY